MSTYFISQTGNDNNKGTSANFPWKTIDKLNILKLLPGDKILFKGGQTFTGNLNIKSSGTNNKVITIASYGSGKAVLLAGNGNGVYIHNNANILIKNLTVKGEWNSTLQTGNAAVGIHFFNDYSGAIKLGSIHISNCEVSGFRDGGIGIKSQPDDKSQSGYSKIIIDSNIVHDNGKFGIATQGAVALPGSTKYAFADVYVAYNKIYNNLGLSEITDTHTGDGLVIGDAYRGIIEHNVAYNNGWMNASNSGGPCGIWCYDSKDIIFQYNESYNNGTSKGKADGDGFDLDGGSVNCIMQYNYSHDNYAAGFLIWEYGDARTYNSNNIIRFNISQNDNTNNDFYAGITVGADGKTSVSSNIVYNNTIYSDKGSCVTLYGGLNTVFYNNIFYNNESNVPIVAGTATSLFFLGNNYYNPNGFMIKINEKIFTALNDFRNSGNESFAGNTYGFDLNPGLKDPGNGKAVNTGLPSSLTNYYLKQGSAMINAGFNLPSIGVETGNFDFNGVKISSKTLTDIGASEYQAK